MAEKRKRYKTKRLVLGGMLTAVAMVLSYVESLLPFSFGMAGIKIGLANIVSLFAMEAIGIPLAFLVLLSRILLSSLLFSSMSTMLYSLAGGVVSFGVMLLLKKSGRFHTVGIGIAGGITHNLAQLSLAAVILGKAIGAYLPVLWISGTVAGTAVGTAAALLNRYLLRFARSFSE